MTTQLTIKTRATINKRVVWKTGSTPIDLTGSTLTCEVRNDDGALVGSIACTPDADQVANRGQFQLYAASATTATWPPGLYSCDIKRVVGDTEYSETFRVRVVPSVTA